MPPTSLVTLFLVAVCACGTSDAGDALPPAAPPVDAHPPQVFVELKVVDVAGDPRALLDGRSLEDVTSGDDVTVIASPNLLAQDHTVAKLQTDELSVTVKPDIRADDSVRLDLALSTRDAAARSWQTSTVVARDQLLLVGGAAQDHERRARLVAVRATVVRSNAELKQIFERRMREHAAKQRAGEP